MFPGILFECSIVSHQGFGISQILGIFFKTGSGIHKYFCKSTTCFIKALGARSCPSRFSQCKAHLYVTKVSFFPNYFSFFTSFPPPTVCQVAHHHKTYNSLTNALASLARVSQYFPVLLLQVSTSVTFWDSTQTSEWLCHYSPHNSECLKMLCCCNSLSGRSQTAYEHALNDCMLSSSGSAALIPAACLLHYSQTLVSTSLCFY